MARPTKTASPTLPPVSALAMPLTLLDVVAALADPGESDLPRLLPMARAGVRALLDDGLTDATIQTHANGVAAKAFKTHSANARQVDAWMASEGADVTDPVVEVISDTRSAAFALGLALGLQIGGAR